MFLTYTQRKTMRAGLGCKFWLYISNFDPEACRFIFNKLPQLVKRPTVQSRAEFFSCFDSFPDVFQIFHNEGRTPVHSSLRYDLFRDAVIHVLNVAFFSAGDMPQSLFSRLRTVALKTPTHSQESISARSNRPSSKQLSCGGCSQNIFSQIYTHCIAINYRQNVGEIEDKVKKPTISFADQLSFFRISKVKESLVISADLKWNTNPPAQTKQREHSIFQRIGSFIEMDRTSVFKKHLLRPFKRLQACCGFSNYITGHLRPQLGQRFSQGMVAKVMQPDPVALFFRVSNGYNFITAFCEHFLELTKSFILRNAYAKLNRDGSFHRGKFTLQYCFYTITEERQFLPALKDWVSLPSNG